MKIPVVFATLLAVALALAPVARTNAQDAPAPGANFDLFYNNLADDGDWYNTPEYGYVWQPYIAAQNNAWRPYSDGYWAQTDDGWTWVSYESFGWAAYHYGRWTRLNDLGWAWVPGYDWGPGWVSWRTSDDYVGWAPLPPQRESVGFEGSVGAPGASFSISYNDVEDESQGYTPAVDANFDIGPQNYCFVSVRNFGAPVLSEVLLPPQQNFTIVQNTVNVTNIYYGNQDGRTVVYDRGGPNYAFISTRVAQPIQRLRLEPNVNPGYVSGNHPAGFNPTQVHNGVLQVAAPVISRAPVNLQQVKPPRVKATLAKAEVVHGWSGVSADPQAVEQARAKIKQQAQAVPKRQPNGNIAMPANPPAKAPVAENRPPQPAAAAPAPENPAAVAKSVPHPPLTEAEKQARREQPAKPAAPAEPAPPAAVARPAATPIDAARAARKAARDQERAEHPAAPAAEPKPAEREVHPAPQEQPRAPEPKAEPKAEPKPAAPRPERAPEPKATPAREQERVAKPDAARRDEAAAKQAEDEKKKKKDQPPQ
jgi:hypothetical protein